MRPGARLQAAIELLDLIDAGTRTAEDALRLYFKARRYAGSGDRRAVGQTVYDVLRRRGELDWRLSRAGLEAGNRRRVWLLAGCQALGAMTDDPHFRDQPSPAELNALAQADAAGLRDAPAPARLNLPQWLEPEARAAFGAAWEVEATAALSGRAATDLRVNRLKADRDDVRRLLADDGIETEILAFAPDALRLLQPARLAEHSLFRGGGFEVQDAGSQLAGHLVGAGPGMRVADICAGAGGKTLLLAAEMGNEGELLASDADEGRLRRLTPRAERAGARNIRAVPVSARSDWPAGWTGSMDRVLIDAPCSGSGTWRRQPEQRWRLSQARLAELCALQQEILDRAAHLVRPGGRLIYVTCSFLTPENETAITEFTARHPGFRPVSLAVLTREFSHLKHLSPDPAADSLRISTMKHGTDSFFAAVLQRSLD